MAQQHINYSFPNDGLGDALRIFAIKQESNNTELYNFKVDKVTGKGLSDTNFTQAEKDKLAALDPDANVQSDWDEGDSGDPAYIKNKPTNISEWYNDSGYVTDAPDTIIKGRIAGAWVDIPGASGIEILDGIIGVTSGFIVSQSVFSLPANKICVGVYINGAIQYKTTVNNASLTNRWSQTGDDVTITKTTVLNNYIYIQYI